MGYGKKGEKGMGKEMGRGKGKKKEREKGGWEILKGLASF